MWCFIINHAAHCHWMTWTVLHLRIENRLAQVALSRFRLHKGAALQNFVVPQRLMGHFARIYSNIYFRDQQSVSCSFLESRIYRPGCNESSPNHESNSDKSSSAGKRRLVIVVAGTANLAQVCSLRRCVAMRKNCLGRLA